MQPRPGQTLSHYRLIEKIGEGGMGVVWSAEDTVLRRSVAVKTLRPEVLGDEHLRRRFIREARAAAAINHPSVATIYETGEADGQVFIVMEFVRGEKLRSRLTGTPVSLDLAFDLAAQMAEGLAAAHAAGIVHRDFKPDNVMVDPDGRVKILDFGLAKLIERRDAAGLSRPGQLETVSAELTRAGVLLGTISYMSPEQAAALPVDARSDLFSFGIVLYEMLAGRNPFRRDNPTETLRAIVDEPAVPLRRLNQDVPEGLESVVACCLSKLPDGRYPDATVLADELRKLDRGSSSSRNLSKPHAQQQTASVAADSTVLGGPKRLGDFEILSELGRGGMGIVYEARQISLNRRVALKTLPPALGLSSQATRRFEREAKAAAKLHHTNIVPVHAISHEQGYHFYAMDLIHGQSLDRVLGDLAGGQADPLVEAAVTRAIEGLPEKSTNAATTSAESASTSLSETSPGGRKWFDAVAKLIAEVAEALEYAHSRGIIHRDIKPANLMLSSEGKLCITDFGLARVLEEPGMTISGSLLGTPAYMSPEQIAAGRVPVDHRTDVYSLGAVLYELLTLQRPFAAESREEVLSAVLTKEPRPPRRFNSKVPVDLETICLKALEKDQDRRYATAGAFATDLRNHLQGDLIAARRAGPVRRVAKAIRRHPTVAAAAGLSVLFLAVLTITAGVFSSRQATEAAQRAMADARYEMLQGEYAEALALVDEALTHDADLADARLLRTRLLVQLDRPAEAVVDARLLLEQEPDRWTTHLILASLARGETTAPLLPTIDAEEHLRVVEQRAPETADAYYLRSLAVDASADAVSLLDRALELDPGHAEALAERVRRHEKLKDFGAALADCERLVAVRPRSAQGRRLKSWIYGSSGNLLGALEEAKAAVELDPDDARNYQRRAQAWQELEVGKADEALADLTRAIELRPEHPEYYKERAETYNQEGRQREAIDDARRALALNPQYRDAYAPLLFALGQLDLKDELRQAMDELAAVSEGWVDATARAWAHRQTVPFYLRLGEMDRAFEEASRAIELAPEAYEAYFVRTRVRRAQKDESGLDADCDAVARIVLTDPLDRLLRNYGLGNTCGRWEQALEAQVRLTDQYPHWHQAWYLRGIATASMGDLETALAIFDRAIELSPNWPFPYQQRAYLFQSMGRNEEAASATAQALEGNPYRGDLHGMQCIHLFRLGRNDEALAHCDEAVRLDPFLDSIYPERAFVLALLGECERAEADLEEAERRAPVSHISAFVYLNLSAAHLNGLVYRCRDLYDPVAALEWAQAGLKLRPNDSGFQKNYARALFRNGRLEEAWERLGTEDDVKGFEAAPVSLFIRSMVAWQLGQRDQALADFERAVALMDKHESGLYEIELRREAAQLLELAEPSPSS